MKSIVLLNLSLFLGLFFIFIGSLKVTHYLHREMHREIRRNFIQYTKVFPLTEQIIGFKLTPKFYRLFVGYLEITCGSFLVVLPNKWKLKNFSNIILIFTNLLSLYTHYKLNDKFERIAPSIVFSLMLTCRLIIYYQAKKRSENQEKNLEKEEEKKKLIENGNFNLGDDNKDNESDEDFDLKDINEEELEKLIKLSKHLHKYQKRNFKKAKNDFSDNFITKSCTQELSQDSIEELNEEDFEANNEEPKKVK